MSDRVHLSVSGVDDARLVPAITAELARHGVEIEYLAHGVAHDAATLGVIVRMPEGDAGEALLKDLLHRAHLLGTDLNSIGVAQVNGKWTQVFARM